MNGAPGLDVLDPDAVRVAVGGTWVHRPSPSRPRPAEWAPGASVDSRTIRPGQVFFALRGDRSDGHLYLAQAAAAGASLAVVDAPESIPAPWPDLPVARVPDARAALLRLGAAYRRTLEGTRVVGVGGSNGKTTTSRLIQRVLALRLRGSGSPRSFNNAIGLPLTILSARRGDQFLVCEIGTNAPGEIAALGRVLQPDIAVITSIGREHLEGLGSIRGVAAEQASILREVRPGGLAIVPADAPDLTEHMAANIGCPILRVGESASADLRVSDIRTAREGTSFRVNDRWEFTIPLLGRHNALNAAFAIAVARRFGLEMEDIAFGLRDAGAADMRLARAVIAGVEVLNDAYNANPDSMLAALETLGRIEPVSGRRWAVLGDMLELGESTDQAHEEVLAAALRPGLLTGLVLVGPRFSRASGVLRDVPPWVVRVPDLSGDGAARAAALPGAGDLVLLKGSRMMGVERVAKALERRCESTTATEPR